MAADIFGRDIITSGIQQMSTVRAAVLALNALGKIKDIEKYAKRKRQVKFTQKGMKHI